MLRILISCIVGWLLFSGHIVAPLQTAKGRVTFRSDAPLELITANSQQLKGIIDPTKKTFAWSVDIKTFEGFNGPLQREHFNENYLESNKYPRATFTGKIIEQIDFQTNGTYTVRAKGTLTIHGVAQERIIKSTVTVKRGVVRIQSAFMVPLADHQINIPRVVYQKIAEDISVAIDAELR
jgi:hypothetical protein